MTDPECFIPGCIQEAASSSVTFHKLPASTNLLRRLLLLLFKDMDPSEFPILKNDSAMCSAHFGRLMSDTDLVHVLVNSMITRKPSQEAASLAPKCAAFCCCINLYSDVPLFIFPSDDKRFTLWRRIAGWPKLSDCKYLCARHFKRNSFLDEERRRLKRGANPLYPTRPFNTTYQNYCPLKRPVPVPQPLSTLDDTEDDGSAKPKIASRKKWRCAAKGCDVSHLTHPDMRRINLPSDPERLKLWREVVGYVLNVKYNTSVCTRHFALSQFYDGESRRSFVKLANPVYPTGPLNINTNDYCPPELDVTVHMEHEGGHAASDSVAASESVITVVEGSRTSEIILVPEDIKHCSAAGCPVNSQTHPNVKLHDFPEANMRKMLVWLKIAGCPTKKPRRLCERHFDIHSRDLIPKYPFGDLDPETRTYKPVFNPVDPKCCVPGCTVLPVDSDLIFHRFPLEKDMFQAWIQRIGCKKLGLYDQGDVFRGFRVCSRHFSRNAYCKLPNSEREMALEPTAVPTSRLGTDEPGSVLSGAVVSEIELEFHDADDDVDADSTSDGHGFCEVVTSHKRKSGMVMVPPYQKRVRFEATERSNPRVDDSFSSEGLGLDEEASDTEDRGLLGASGMDTVISKGDRSGGTEEHDRANEFLCDTAGVEEDDESSSSESCPDDDSQPPWDIIAVAVRMCKIDSRRTKGMQNVTGKRRVALDVLGNILCHGLMDLVNNMGLRFITNCFSRILDFPMRVSDNDSVVSDLETDEEELEQLNDELMKFSTILLTFSRKLYSAISQVATLPSPYRVRNWLISGSGVPGMSQKGFLRLKEKRELVGSKSFLVSLAVVEIPLRKEVSWTGKEVFGFVDLGHGRITDVTTEATAVIVFYANSPTHDFQTPLGYCLINSLPPPVRANLISLYLIQIHSMGIRCNSVVCEDSVVTHQTYQELGIVRESGIPVNGYFAQPGQKSEQVFCFVDVEDCFRSVSNILAESTMFLTGDSSDVRWADVETVNGLPRWDLSEFPVNATRFQYLRSIQLKLKKDPRVFKKNSSLVLRALKKHSKTNSGTGSSEFLAKMDTIDNLFSGRNIFCKESPAVNRSNVMISLGRIRNALVYISALKDLSGCKLLKSSRMNFSGLALNLVSLEGYLKRLLLTERRHPNDRATAIRTNSLTLRDVRSAVRGLCVEMATAKEFRSALKSSLKNGRKPHFKSEKPTVDETRPVHVGLNVVESYKYETLNTGCEHIEEYLMKNVVCRWLDETSCPDCCFVVSMETTASCIGGGLTSGVRKLLRAAERCLRTAEEIPLEGDKFSGFVCSVLHEMSDFSGFLSAGHLFDSVEFGRTSHFTTMVSGMLRIFLRYRIGFMSTTTKVFIRPDSRHTSFHRSAVSL